MNLQNLTTTELDNIQKIYNDGILEGIKHSKPSPETLERLEKIETAMKDITDMFMEHSKQRDEHLQQMLSEFREGIKDVKRVTGLLDNSSFMVKFFVGLGSFFMFMGGAYLMVKSILHGQN